MKKIISVLLSILIVSSSLFVVIGVEKGVGYSTHEQLLETEYGITDAQLIYNNTIDSAEDMPVKEFYNYTASKTSVVDGRWYVKPGDGQSLSSKNGMLGKSVADFAYFFEFEPKGGWAQACFAFHSENAHPSNFDAGKSNSYIKIIHSENAGNPYPILCINGENTSNKQYKLAKNKIHNVLLIVRQNEYDLYIWEKGKTVEEPVISVTKVTTKTGDFNFHNYQANHYIDNIKVYDLSLLNKNLAGAKLLYSEDFNASDAIAPMGISAAIENNELKISGENITSSAGLTGLNTLSEFQFMAEYSTSVTEGVSEEWQFANKSFSLNITPNVVSLISDSRIDKDFSFESEKTYQLAVRYKDGKVNIYIWEKGCLSPQKPIIEHEIGTVCGDINYAAAKADAIYDNIKVYDLTKVEEDKSLKKLAEWNFDNNKETIPIKSTNGITYGNGTLVFNATSSDIFTEGFFGAIVSDMFWQFDYIPKNVSSNEDSFIFHYNDENKSYLAMTILGNDVANGNNLEIRYVTHEGTNTLSKVSVGDFTSNKKYTFRIMCVNGNIYVKYWLQNAGTPDTYTLSAKIEISSLYNGDFAISSSKGDFELDRMTVYRNIPELSEYDEAEVEETIKLVDYNFDDETAEIPFKMVGDTELSTLSYSKNRLYLQTNWEGKAVWSNNLLDKKIKDFVWQFDYTTTEYEWNNDFFAFRANGTDVKNNLGLRIKGGKYRKGGNNVFIEKCENGITTTLAETYVEGINEGVPHKIRIQMLGDQIKIWIWASDEATPEECLLQAINDVSILNRGEIRFYGYQTFFYLDDMVIYSGNPERSLLDTESLAERQQKSLLLDTDFSGEKDLLFDTKEPAKTEVKDGKFIFVSGEKNMLYGDALIDGVEVYDLSWQFEYTPHSAEWNTDRFVFHSDGKKEGNALYIELQGSGTSKKTKQNLTIVRRYSASEKTILASTNVSLIKNTTYTIRIICKGNTIYVYYWNSGLNTPTEPTLTATCSEKTVKKGKFLIQGYQSNFSLDDMRIYNYADAEQVNTVLKPLPDNVRLLNLNFNGLRGKTEFPFEMTECLKYWQNTLNIKTPDKKAITSKNLIGDYPLEDLCWEFQIRDFNAWSVNKFIIHAKDGGQDNCIYLLYCGQNTAGIKSPTGHAPVEDGSSLRLIQVVDGNATLIGKAKVELKRGKAYNVKITSLDNRIEVTVGSKRSGKMEKVISAQASDKVSSGMTMISGYQTNMWLDNLILSNSSVRADKVYEGSFYSSKE